MTATSSRQAEAMTAILQRMAEKKMTQAWLADVLAATEAYVSRRLRPDSRYAFSLIEVEVIADQLGLDAEQLVSDLGLLVTPRPYVVGITGASGAGKTWLGSIIRDRLTARGLKTFCVSADAFYRRDEVIQELPQRWDSPLAVDWPELEFTVRSLRGGIRTALPAGRDYTRSERIPKIIAPSALDVVLVEGHLILWSEELAVKLVDQLVWIETPLSECWARRVSRDTVQRGLRAEDVERQIREEVRPAFEVYLTLREQYASRMLRFANDLPLGRREVEDRVGVFIDDLARRATIRRGRAL